MAIELRPFTAAGLDGAVALCVDAFANSTLYKYVGGSDEALRRRLLASVFTFRLGGVLESGRPTDLAVDTDGGRLLGFCAWEGPEGGGKGASANADSGMDKAAIEGAVLHLNSALAKYPADIVQRWEHFHRVLFGAFAAALNHPCWDLGPIAVHPSAQGRGISSLLIRPRLAEIAAARLPCYLGTQDERNLAIYSRFGFRVIRTDAVAEGINTYVMKTD